MLLFNMHDYEKWTERFSGPNDKLDTDGQLYLTIRY